MAGVMCCSRTPVREMDVYFRTKWTQGYQEFLVIHHHLAQGDDNLFSDKMMIFFLLWMKLDFMHTKSILYAFSPLAINNYCIHIKFLPV